MAWSQNVVVWLLRLCAQLSRAFNRYTVMRRIFKKRRLNSIISRLQKLWRHRMLAIKIRAATLILPLLQRHLWYMRRQRMRSLRHDAARAMQVRRQALVFRCEYACGR